MAKDRIGIKGIFEEYWFDPQEDISVWELTQCMQFIIRAAAAGWGAIENSKEWASLSDEARRHFEVEENDVF